MNIDLTPPTLAVAAPTEGHFYVSGLWALDFAKSDALSGLDASREAIVLDGSPATAAAVAAAGAGAHTVSVTEYDLAGNSTTVIRHFVAMSPPAMLITAPSATSFTQGDSTTVGWSINGAVSVGSFRVWLKNTLTNAWAYITPTGGNIAAVENQMSYSVPWNVNQPAGSYKLWVYYYGPDGSVKATAVAASTITIGQKPTPVISAPLTPATFTQGNATSVTWTMTSPVSSGSFRAMVKNIGTGTWSNITPTASPVLWSAPSSPYSQSWTVNQAPGTYKLWVYYYDASGNVSSTAVAGDIITVLQKPTPTITSPNNGTFSRGSSQVVTWSMSPAASSGSFRLWLKNTVAPFNWVAITPTASPIPWNEVGAPPYSAFWFMTQPAGAYKLWVYYYSAGGAVISTASSSGTITLI